MARTCWISSIQRRAGCMRTFAKSARRPGASRARIQTFNRYRMRLNIVAASWAILKIESWSSLIIRRSSCAFSRNSLAIRVSSMRSTQTPICIESPPHKSSFVAQDQVTKEQRDFAKRLNFGGVDGIGAQRFSMMTGLSLTEAENVLRRYFATYRGLDTYLRESANRAVSEKQARTGSGRLVRFNFDASDRQQVSMTQRNGKNAPIQGTSADILKRALRLLIDELRNTSAKIVNIIHDEIVVEVDDSESKDVAQKVERAMCAAGEEYLTTVPVKVESQIASQWAK